MIKINKYKLINNKSMKKTSFYKNYNMILKC